MKKHKHRCSYCGKEGATLGCSVSQCRKQFHLPCGRQRNAVSLFYGNYKSFCQLHAPKQNIPAPIMNKARVRMKEKNKALKAAKANGLSVAIVPSNYDSNDALKAECVCVICYEEVDAFPTTQTFWPPCCANDSWFHRSCLERMALSAGMHYLKCPLCNDKDNFYQAVIQQGYYVPDRDAAWELEQNAFAEIYERPLSCSVSDCKCPLGPNHDAEIGQWDIKLCLLCGSVGIHAQCLLNSGVEGPRFICTICQPAAPQDIEELATAIESIIVKEQARSSSNVNRPIMPSRMSLRRTKQRMAYMALEASDEGSSSTCMSDTSNTTRSRQELNIKPPKRRTRMDNSDTHQDVAEKFMSPVKLLEETLREKKRRLDKTETENIMLDEGLIESLRRKMRKPKPLCEKKKIVDGMLEEYLNNLAKEPGKTKEPIKEWNSPKKDAALSEITAEGNHECIQRASCIKGTTDEYDSNVSENNIPALEDILSTNPQKLTRLSTSHGSSANFNSSLFDTDTHDASTTSFGEQNKNSESPEYKIKRDLKSQEGVDQNMSPVTLLKNSLSRRKLLGGKGGEDILSDDQLGERLRRKMQRPKPLSKKMKIVDRILAEYLDDSIKDNAMDCDVIEEFTSPQSEVTADTSIEGTQIHSVTLEKEFTENTTASTILDTTDNPTQEPIDSPPIIDEESSNSTFVLPSEFIADRDSDDSLPVFDTPKTLKTVNIQKDSSMEISEKNDKVNIDLVKIESKDECDVQILSKLAKCALKFNPKSMEVLKNTDEGIDIESFKSQYLNEVGRHFKSEFSPKHESRSVSPQIKPPIGFAMDAEAKSGRKRKLKGKRRKKEGKRRKMEDVVLRFRNDIGKNDRKRKKNEKSATSLSITNDDMQVKISLKKKKFRLKIMKSRRKSPPRNLKQYVLNYSENSSILEKPDEDVTPMKRKYVKQNLSPDNLKQTSLLRFFKTKE